MDLSAFVGKLLEEQDGDVLREGIRVLSQALMETEVAGLIGADRHERSADRSAYRNGYRLRTWETRVGTIELAIPKVRPGTYFPPRLEPRRRAERALLAVVQEAYVHEVSPRKVDELLKAFGRDGMSKSKVSRLCPELDCQARQDGFDLHAGVRVGAGQRERLEQVCQGMLRPPIAQDRLAVTETGHVRLTVRHRWADGTTHLEFDPVAFLERLAVLVPRPRVHLISIIRSTRSSCVLRSAPSQARQRARQPARRRAGCALGAPRWPVIARTTCSTTRVCGIRLALLLGAA